MTQSMQITKIAEVLIKEFPAVDRHLAIDIAIRIMINLELMPK